MDERATQLGSQAGEDEVLLVEKFIKKYQWIEAQLKENRLHIQTTASLFHNGIKLDGLQVQINMSGGIQLNITSLDKFNPTSELYNAIQNCDICSQTRENILVNFNDDTQACAKIIFSLAKLRKSTFDSINTKYIIETDIDTYIAQYYKIRFDSNVNYIDKELNDNNIIAQLQRIQKQYPKKSYSNAQQSYSKSNNNINWHKIISKPKINIDWRKIIFVPILLLSVIYPMLCRNVGGLEDFMKEVASEYNAPLSEVENELLSAIRSEYNWFPLPNTIWYVTKDNGEDVTVGRSDVFGTDVYKDKLDDFFYLEFWRGRKSLEEMQMDAIRERMGRK